MDAGLIFDLDGVLISTDIYHRQAWAAVAAKLGIAVDDELADQLRGISRMASLDRILARYDGTLSMKEKEDLASEKNSIYRWFLESLSPSSVAGDVMQALSSLRRQGYRMAIGSSSRNARFIADRTGLRSFFDIIIDGSMIRNAKPDPEVFLLASSGLGLPPGHCIVIEDSESGIDAARRAGCLSIATGSAVSYGKADAAITSFQDLAEAIAAIRRKAAWH